MELDTNKLDELLELTRENNKILTGMRSTARWGSFFKVIYWTVILGSIVGVYYYFQPTIQKYANVLQTSVGIIQDFQKSAGEVSSSIQSLTGAIKK
ncbi:MAG: hypothetical protein WC791_03845 [Candidatus Paceibacterota bacterium]|jgi:uncharacterized membrane protein